MTVLMGVLARCLYAIGDIALYKGVLGYEFSDSTLRKACGTLSLLGFAGIIAILPQAGYIEWLMYGMLWLGMLLLLQRLQFGLVVFVFLTRITLTNLIDGILIIIFMDNDITNFFEWEYMDIYCILVQLFFVLLIAILYAKQRKYSWKEKVKRISDWMFMIGAAFIAIPLIMSWTWTIFSNSFKSNNYNFMESNMLSLAIIALAISSFILIEKNGELNEQIQLNDRCIREQTEQYRMLNEKQKELKGFRHDINGHLIVMRRMASHGKYDELIAYLDKLSALQEDTFYLSSNNIIGDAIFNFYYDKGCSEGIKVKVVGKFPDKLDLAETDLCIVLSNTVANAYEAALKCGKGSVVTVELSEFGGRTMIVITNPVSEDPEIKDGIMTTTKENKENHGLGISNTMKALEKYDGQIIWEKSENKIVTKIVF